MKKLILATAAAAAASMTVAAAPAVAQQSHWSTGYERAGYRDYERGYDRGYDRDYGRGYDRGYDRTYDDNGRYREPRKVRRGDNVWRGNDGRYYCERDNGTTGLIIGAAGGALLGREIDKHGERTTGTILGAVLGGLLGRELDKSDAKCR
jgi:opacity protein-like surface antigen